MKKLPEKFSVYAKTIEEAEYIIQKQKEIWGSSLSPSPQSNHFYRFSPTNYRDRWGQASSSYLDTPILLTFGIQHEFTFEEFKSYFEEEFVLPDTWYVVVTEENKDVLRKWKFLPSSFLTLKPGNVVGMYKWGGDKITKEWNPKRDEGWENEITFEQFKKYVLKENNMEKEIIGYKLIKPEYEKAVFEIIEKNSIYDWNIFLEEKGYPKSLPLDCISTKKLIESGVLDLWFEPIYKEEKKDIVLTLLHGKQVTITKEGVILAAGSRFFIDTIKRIYDHMFVYNETLSGYSISAETINIGCWRNITKSDLELIILTQEKQVK